MRLQPDGDLLHDDFIVADSLVAVLDRQSWEISLETHIIPSSVDPHKEMEGKY